MREAPQATTIGRNDPCWCGSGQKYKKCHLSRDAQGGASAPVRPAARAVPRSRMVSNIPIMDASQIEGIRRAGLVNREMLDMLSERIEAGITTEQIDQWVHEHTLSVGGRPATLGYKGYPKSTCTSVNEVVCHGIPGERLLADGDIVNVDVTTILNGFYGDSSRMFLVGNVNAEARKLVEVTRECLELGIAQVKPGNTIGDIGAAIQAHAEGHGFSVVRDFVGHGIGQKFHQEPQVPHFGRKGQGEPLLPGMVFTIEPMINQGDWRVKILDDDWTAVTRDGSLSAQFEHTVVVTTDGVDVLTA